MGMVKDAAIGDMDRITKELKQHGADHGGFSATGYVIFFPNLTHEGTLEVQFAIGGWGTVIGEGLGLTFGPQRIRTWQFAPGEDLLAAGKGIGPSSEEVADEYGLDDIDPGRWLGMLFLEDVSREEAR